MKAGEWILIGIGAFVVWNLTGLARAANVLQVVFKGVSVSGLTSLKITLTIQNPSNATLQINSMVGTITVNGNELGNISTFNQVTVLPNSQQDVIIDLGIGILDLPAVIQNVIQQPLQSYDVSVTGTANVNGIMIPISTNSQFAL